MTDTIIRSIEILAGMLLIVATLFLAGSATSQAAQTTVVLMSLFALPLVFSGLFNWHPAKVLGNWLSRAKKPMVSLIPHKLRSLTH
ncbi:MAG: hypothetical protein PVF34_10075 [Gammaproteobacteria bacterium]|jgi:hypothetical protein